MKQDEPNVITTLKRALPQMFTPPAAPASVPLPGVQAVAPTPSDSDENLEKKKKLEELSQYTQRFQAEMEQWRMDRELKKSIATVVFRFLAVETFCVFIVVLFQGFRPVGFHLDDSTINIFLAATLLQISSMAIIITRHLYPTSESK